MDLLVSDIKALFQPKRVRLGLTVPRPVTRCNPLVAPLMHNGYAKKGAVMKRILLVCALLSMLSACAVYTPGGSVVVDPDPGYGHGGFCPPGQAKKGNC